MAVNGDLEDISLFYVVQMICIEGRSAALLLKRSGEKGMIFFENGEIVHSVTSSNQLGEKAFCYLLGWTKGTFHLKMDAPITNRTISASWKRLLMEAVQQIDEGKTALTPRVHQPLSPDDIKHDYELEQELISLLSNLEVVQNQLVAKKIMKNPEAGLQLVVGMVNDVISMGERYFNTEQEENRLGVIIKEAGNDYPSMKFMQNTGTRFSVEAIQGCVVLNELSSGASKQKIYQEVLLGIFKVMGLYFQRILNSFRSNFVADQWRETSEIFVQDLRSMVKEMM